MSLASKFRWLPTPTYGVCGGARKNCAIRREDLDPLDQQFFDHDQRCELASKLGDPYEREAGKKEADRLLVKALSDITDEDMKKIPYFVWKWPFFKREYAKKYRKICIDLVFKENP